MKTCKFCKIKFNEKVNNNSAYDEIYRFWICNDCNTKMMNGETLHFPGKIPKGTIPNFEYIW